MLWDGWSSSAGRCRRRSQWRGRLKLAEERWLERDFGDFGEEVILSLSLWALAWKIHFGSSIDLSKSSGLFQQRLKNPMLSDRYCRLRVLFTVTGYLSWLV